MSIKNFNVKNGLTVGVASIDAASGNIVAGNANLGNLATANFFGGNANALFNIQGANVVGTVANATNASTAGTVTANAQPNITSVGTLSSLSVTGNVSAGGILTNNYYYANGAPVDFQQAAGSNTQIQFNNNNDFGASANFTFDSSTNQLTVTGNANVSTAVNSPAVNGGSSNLTLSSNSFSTVFDNTGNVTFPVNSVVSAGSFDGAFTVGAGNKTILFSDDGNVNGSTGFTFDTASNLVALSGNLNLGLTGVNQLVNASNTQLEVRAGYGNATNSNLKMIAGDGANTLNWSAIRLQGNLAGNSAIIAESVHTYWRQPTQASNVVVIDTVSINSTNTSTGALQVGGGIGASGNVNVGGALSVTGNIANANNISATNGLFANSANITANLTSGNANLGNLAIASYVQTGELLNGNSNIRIAANGNVGISAAGTSNVVLVSASGANVVGYVQANGNGTFGALLSPTLTSNSGALTLAPASGNNNVILAPTGTGNVDVSGRFITSVSDPTNAQDAATKAYVDSVATGLQIHPAVRVTSATNLNATYANGGSSLTTIAISGGKTIQFSGAHGLSVNDEIYWANSFNGITSLNGYFVQSTPASDTITVRATYTGAEVINLTNGTGLTQGATANSGVGATLTNAGANAAISIDGVALSSSDRVLVQGQTNQFENGVYTVTTVGNGSTAWVLTRATDGDQYAPSDVGKLGYGDYFFISSGSNYAGSSYVLTTPTGEIVFGITNIAFSQFAAAGSYSAGNGIAINGTVISANTDGVTTDIVGGNIVVKSSAQLTTPNIGAATGTSVSLSANVLAGNVNSNALVSAANVNASANVLANNLNANANITANNATINLALSGNTANFSGNVLLNNLTINLELSGNSANFSGNVYADFVQAGIGNSIPNLTNPLFAGIANANNFVQAYVHNESTGPAASADFIAYPDNGDDISGWVDLGITSSTFNAAAFSVTEENEGYVFMSAPDSSGTSGNLVFATDSTGTHNSIEFFVDGFNKTKAERTVLIDTTGLSVTGNTTSTGAANTGIGAIKAGVTNTILPNTVASFSANVNNYVQVTLQNKSTGADATADFIVTADNGTDTVNYLDMGIINSGYDANTPTNSLGNIVAAADSYIYAQGNTGNASQSGGNLAIGTTVAGKSVKIFAGGANNTAIVANISNTGVAVTGLLSATGNANVLNLGTARVLATGNVTAPQLISNVANGTAPLVVTSQTVVTNLNADLLDGYNSATANTANTVAIRNADGNLAANYFIGNGAFLTGIDTSGIQNGNSNVSIPSANGNINMNSAGNLVVVVTGTGANITGYANISGNANVGNLGATGVVATTLGGSLTTASQPNITSVGTLTSLAVTNNGTFGNVYANSGTIGASLLTGTLTTNAQPNVTSVGTLTSLAVSGNVTAGNVTGANLVSANFVTGTLTTNAQPNITSVGSLTSLDVTGNVTAEYIKPIGYSTDRANVSVTTNTVVDQFNPSTFRTAKYVISASGDDGYQSVETLLVHDGVDAYITIYGSVCSNVSADIIDISANINGVSGNVAVYATTASGNVIVNVVASYIKT